MIQIRTYEPSDRDLVIHLWRECALVVPQNDPHKDIDRKLAHSPDLFLVATDGAEIVGSVMAGYDGHRGNINYLAVAPPRQGSGIGRRLMSEAAARLAALGCPKINLIVRGSNTRVLAFYERIGYHVEQNLQLGYRLVNDSEP